MKLTSFRFPTQIRFGPGARQGLAEFSQLHQVQRPLLVSDSGLPATDAYQRVAATMDQVWPQHWQSFSGIHPNPLDSDADAAYSAYRAAGCDAVVGVGGGSAIDGAKALVARIGFPEQPMTEISANQLARSIVPLCAIPTTAGTGSEVGWSTVLTVTQLGRKVMVYGNALLPSLALLDPELTVGLPPGLTAATGMDAMTHAIESFVCPSFHPMCDGVALEAIYRARRFLPRAVHQGGDLTARGEMLMAAAMGALAFQKDLGAAHSLAHPLSTEFGTHHGLANAVVLPAVVRFNGETHSSAYTRVALALGLVPDADPAAQVADFLDQFNRSIGITQRLRDLGVDQASLPKLAHKAFCDACHQTNPRRCSEADLMRLYQETY